MSFFSKSRTLFSVKPVKKRSYYMVLFLVCVVSLSVAWHFQNMGYAPCTLCVVQRYFFWLLGFVSLIGLLRGYLSRWLTWVSAMIGGLGVSVAAYHNWIIMHPSSTCAPDKLQEFLNNLSIAIWWSDLFSATGICAAELPLFFGMTMPQGSLVILFALTLGFIFVRSRTHR